MAELQNISPFFKVRRILTLLRLLLGFPLKPQSKEFCEFSFIPGLEYLRYMLYMSIGFSTSGFMIFLYMKNGNASNPFIVQHNAYSSIGLSMLDMIVIQCIPFISYVSSFFYLKSFKKATSSINKVCLRLSLLNCELKQLIYSPKKSQAKQKNSSLKLLFLGIALTLVVTIFYLCATLGLIFEGVLGERFIRKEEITPFAIAVALNCVTWVYPILALSSDFVVCHLLEALEESFLSWNQMLKLKKCRDGGTTAEGSAKGNTQAKSLTNE